MRKRNNAVYVRFSDEEYRELMEKVKESGLTIQAYIIKAALGAAITTETDRALLLDQNRVFWKMEQQLRGIGTNVNQMSRHANTYGQLPHVHELTRIGDEVSCIRREVDEAWQSTRRLISGQ